MPVIKSEIMESYKRSEMIAFQINSSDIPVDDLKVYVTNNGFDSAPVWEDATQELLTDDLYYFVNETKTSDKWGVGIKIVVGEENSPISMLLTYSPTEINNNKVVVTVNVNAECGLSYIKTPDGITHTISGTSNTLTYEIITNGDYTFEAKNTNGDIISKILTISNIDKTAPTITITPISTFDDFVDKVNVEISCSDDTALKELKLPDNTIETINGKTYETTYEITSNGVYKFEVFDSVGNSTSESITINNIDGSAPTLELKVDITNITNSDVIITAIATDDTGLATIQKNEETPVTISGTTNTSTYTISENGTYTFVVTDEAGKTTTKDIEINNIDKDAPTLELSANPTEETLGNVIITAISNDNMDLASIQKDSETPIAISGVTNESIFTINKNGVYSFITKDTAGNSITKSITIDNIRISTFETNVVSDVITESYDKSQYISVRAYNGMIYTFDKSGNQTNSTTNGYRYNNLKTILATPDNGFIIGGQQATTEYPIINKFKEDLTLEWTFYGSTMLTSKTYCVNKMLPLQDGGYMVCAGNGGGSSLSGSFLARINNLGEVLTYKTFTRGVDGFGGVDFTDMISIGTDRFLVIGTLKTCPELNIAGEHLTFVVFIVDTNFNIIKKNAFTGTDIQDYVFMTSTRVVPLNNGGFLCYGCSRGGLDSNGNNFGTMTGSSANGSLLEIDSNLNFVSNKLFVFSSSSVSPYEMIKVAEDKFLISEKYGYIGLYDRTSNTITTKYSPQSLSRGHYFYATEDGGAITAGGFIAKLDDTFDFNSL